MAVRALSILALASGALFVMLDSVFAATAPNPAIPPEVAHVTIASLIATHGDGQAERVRRGVTQVAQRWWPADGDPTAFAAFCTANFLTNPAALAGTMSRLERVYGEGNINLVSIGDYEHPKVRFPGSFGAAYLYYVVPKVILFRTEHSRRTLVPKVSFVSAPGSSPDNVYRDGGPIALVTNRCVFSFDKARRRFRLESVNPGHTVEEVAENTGFAYEQPANVAVTPAPSAETLRLIRQVVAPELSEVYPQFARKVFGAAH